MSSRHPVDATLERFAALELSQAAMMETGRHLFACRSCRLRLRTEIPGGTEVLRRLESRLPTPSPDEYDRMFVRLEGKVREYANRVAEERRRARRLLAALDRLPPARQRERVHCDERFHNPSLVGLLLDRAREVWRDEPATAEGIAELAFQVADRLAPSVHGSGLQNDLRARAMAYVANARRIQYDLQGAADAFGEAENYLAEGSADPLERARVLELKAVLLRAQRRLDGALRTVRDTARIYRQVGDPHLEGQALVSEALIHAVKGNPGEGIDLFYQAVAKLDPDRDPHLAYVAYHNLVVDLLDSGRTAEASALFLEVKRVSAKSAGQIDLIRVLWVEAAIDAASDRLPEAEAKFLEVRRQFIERDAGYVTALVSLELAKVYLQQGRIAETKRLAAEMHTLFASREIQRDALAALILFQRAAEQESATVQMVDEIVRYLKRTHGGNQGQPPAERPT